MALNIRQKALVKIYLKTGNIKVGKENLKPENRNAACKFIKCSQHDFKSYEKTLNLRQQEATRKETAST